MPRSSTRTAVPRVPLVGWLAEVVGPLPLIPPPLSSRSVAIVFSSPCSPPRRGGFASAFHASQRQRAVRSAPTEAKWYADRYPSLWSSWGVFQAFPFRPLLQERLPPHHSSSASPPRSHLWREERRRRRCGGGEEEEEEKDLSYVARGGVTATSAYSNPMCGAATRWTSARPVVKEGDAKCMEDRAAVSWRSTFEDAAVPSAPHLPR